MKVQDNGMNEIPVMSTDEQANSEVILPSKSITIEDIETWLISYLAELLDIEPETVDVFTAFANYGLDSAAAVVMVGDIENWLKCKLPESLLFDYPTIEKLSLHLAN